MKTQILESKTAQAEQEIQLVKGTFTPTEASHIICRLIDEKINFHKLQRLQMWEGDHVCKTNPLDNRISELMEEKKIAREFISKLMNSGKNLQINGTLEISLID